MQTNEKKYWFPAKKYGWGWGPPCAWQGWVVILLYVVLSGGGCIAITRAVPPNVGAALGIGYVILLTTILCFIGFLKGEPPRWRWGEPKQKSVEERLAELKELRGQRLISEAEYEAKRQEILKEL